MRDIGEGGFRDWAMLSDVELAVTSRTEDAALVALWSRLEPLAQSVLRRELDDAADTEWLLQEVYAKLHAEIREKVKRIRRPVAWIRTTSHHLAVNHNMKESRSAPRDPDALIRLETVSNVVWMHGAAQSTVSDETDLVRFCLDLIDAYQAEVVRLHDIDGYKFREIAERLELTIDQVRGRYANGSKALRAALLANGYVPCTEPGVDSNAMVLAFAASPVLVARRDALRHGVPRRRAAW